MDKRKSFLNIAVSIVFKILTTVGVIITRRFLIRFCGNEVNGLNSLYLSIIGILAVAELGIGNAITFCMYKPIVEGEQKTVAALYNLFKKIYWIVGLVILIAGIALTPFLKFLAKDYDRLDVDLYRTFLLMLISTVVTYGYGAKTALIIAHKNNYITTTIASAGVLFQYGLQVIVLLWTRSFEWYLACRIISAVAQGIATDYIVGKKYDHVVLEKKQQIDITTRHTLFKSIKAMFMHKIGTLLVNTADNLIISICIGVVSLGEYSNYATVKSALVSIIGLVFTSVTSILGHLYVAENREVSKKYCDFFHLLNFILGTVFFLGYYAVIDSLVAILFAPELVVAKSISFVIAMNGFVQFMRSSILVFRDATGTFYNDRWKPLAEGIVNIILSILFVKTIGTTGVILATIITNLTICHLVEPYILYKNAFSFSPKEYYKRNYGMIVCFFLAMVVMDLCMQSCENIFAEFLLNGFISLFISIPICIITILLQWKNCHHIFTDFFRRRKK